MKDFSFTADVTFKDGGSIQNCKVSGSVAATGYAEGVIITAHLPSARMLSGLSFEIHGKLADGADVLFSDARGMGWEMSDDLFALKFKARSLRETRDEDKNVPQRSLQYDLTNLMFAGNEVTEKQQGGRMRWRRDRLRFLYEDYVCELRQLDNYDSLIKELRDRNGSAVTSTLTIISQRGQRLDGPKVDDFADAVCELLSFATKNTVFWVSRKEFNSKLNATQIVTRAVSNLSFFQSGWSLIPDYGPMPDGKGRFELAYFLGSVTLRYVQRLRTKGLGLAIAWILDSERQSTIDMKYIAAFIAVERLRAKFLDRTAVPAALSEDWNERVNEGLGEKVVGTIEASIGTLKDEQKRLIISKLRSANTPPVALELGALCAQLNVFGFDKEMGELRSKLVHTGGYGDFDFPEAVTLYRKLSHVVDVCVLRLLEFDGFYQHWANDWKPTLLAEHVTSRA